LVPISSKTFVFAHPHPKEIESQATFMKNRQFQRTATDFAATSVSPSPRSEGTVYTLQKVGGGVA